MRLLTLFSPKTALSRDETRQGLRVLTLENMASTGFSSITGSAFIVAFALALGASNFQIGILAAIPLVTDIFQLPAVWLIERFRHRKLIVFITWLFSQLLWVPIALIPLLMATPGAAAISMLIGLMAVRGMLNAFTNCGWSSWLRDLIPQKVIGRYFARRLSLATTVSIVLGLGAACFLNYWDETGGGALGYTCVLLFGLVFFGLASPAFTALVPEPRMLPAAGREPPFLRTVTRPLRDGNYRQLLKFLMFWGFASSMAFPFFEVFMLRDLKIAILAVIILAIVTELFTAIALRVWGPLADRFGSKMVMSASTVLFLLVILGWSFVVLQGEAARLLPFLVMLHVLEGTAIAGYLLAEETLSLKLAPRAHATSYTSGASLADSAGTGFGVLAGGLLADFFTGRTLNLDLSWLAPLQGNAPAEIKLAGFYFLFALSFFLGLLTLGVLRSVHEPGTARREAALRSLFTETAPVFGLTFLAPAVSLAAGCMTAKPFVPTIHYADQAHAPCRSTDPVKTPGHDLMNRKCGKRKKPPPEGLFCPARRLIWKKGTFSRCPFRKTALPVMFKTR